MRYRHFVRGITEATELIVQLRPNSALIAADRFDVHKPARELYRVHKFRIQDK